MEAKNYVKEIQGGDVRSLTKSGFDLAKLAVADAGGIHPAAEKSKLANLTIQKIVHNGEKGAFLYSSWETFFNALILKKTA